MKTTLFFLLLAGLVACQPANPQATASPKPSPTISATIAEASPSVTPSLQPEPAPSSVASPTATASPSSDLAQPLNLKYQAPVRLNQAELELNFTELVQDSRCPSDVTCVWAGEVTVKVQLKQGGQLVGVADLTLTGDPAKASAKLGDYQLTLLAVTPYPVSTQARQAADYQIQVQLDVLLDLIKTRPQKTLE